MNKRKVLQHKKLKVRKVNKWKEFLETISKKQIGSEVTRQELVKKSYYGRYHTIDAYIGLFKKLEIFEIKSPGIYIKKKSIKKTWTISYLREIAYSDNWKSWFVQI